MYIFPQLGSPRRWRKECGRLTGQRRAHGGEGVELELVHDAEAGALLQDHEGPARKQQGQVEALRHDAQPEDPWGEPGRERAGEREKQGGPVLL